jgi:hypothetical protein
VSQGLAGSIRRVARAALVFGGAAAIMAIAPRSAAAQNVEVISKMGAKCLNAEGGSTSPGVKLIGYPCGQGASNEIFWFNTDGRITQGSLCVDDAGGAGNDGDQIILYTCKFDSSGRPVANQRWTYTSSGQLQGINGKCIDLKGGTGWWNLPGTNQPAILYSCNGQTNQTWFKAPVVPRSQVSGTPTVLQPGSLSTITPATSMSNGVINAGAGNIIAAGSYNVIAPVAPGVINAGAHN